ncbi:hypothetical protein C0J52_22650 [Blattella germanica]|nr:hypothetical protein C0J52_22650 [Blattella germanica]
MVEEAKENPSKATEDTMGKNINASLEDHFTNILNQHQVKEAYKTTRQQENIRSFTVKESETLYLHCRIRKQRAGENI